MGVDLVPTFGRDFSCPQAGPDIQGELGPTIIDICYVVSVKAVSWREAISHTELPLMTSFHLLTPAMSRSFTARAKRLEADVDIGAASSNVYSVRRYEYVGRDQLWAALLGPNNTMYQLFVNGGRAMIAVASVALYDRL
jgi:hypothetical protein